MAVALILGLALLAGSCSSGTTAPNEEEGTAIEKEMPAEKGRKEDIISIEGPADQIAAIKAITKSKMAF